MFSPTKRLSYVVGRLPLVRLLWPPAPRPECGHFFAASLAVPGNGEWVVPFLGAWAVAAAGMMAMANAGPLAGCVWGLVILHVLVLSGSVLQCFVKCRHAGQTWVHAGLLTCGWLAWRGGDWMRAVAIAAGAFWLANGMAWLWLRLRESIRGAWVLFIGLHLVPVAAGRYGGGWWAAGACLGVGTLLAAGTFLHGSYLFGATVRGFPTRKKEVCLTIDDGPATDTTAVLEMLAERGQRAVFFLIGDRAAERPGDVRRIVEAGHVVGNHTQTHPAKWFWAYAPGALRREISQCQETLQSLTGQRPELFRAPVGFYNPFCHAAVQEQYLEAVGWRGHSRDGVCSDVTLVLSRLRRGLRPGGILLMHQGLPHSLAVLRGLLDMLEREGWALTIPAVWEAQPAPGGTLPASYSEASGPTAA